MGLPQIYNDATHVINWGNFKQRKENPRLEIAKEWNWSTTACQEELAYNE